MEREDRQLRTVQVHTAGTWTEAMVIRGLLESAGIVSPGSISSDPFPMLEPPEGTRGTEIVVLESHAEEARRVIAEYLASSESIEADEGENEAT